MSESREVLELAWMRNLCHGGMVREIRLAAGLSLAEVARDVGVCASAVHSWETSRTIPRGKAAAKYAKLLRELESLARR